MEVGVWDLGVRMSLELIGILDYWAGENIII